MALATICPHCHTTFRVASDQLKLRGGIVRCGACNEVFDGSAALVDLDAVPAEPPVPAPAPIAAAPLEAPVELPIEQPIAPSVSPVDADIGALPVLHSVVEAEAAPDGAEPVYTLDFDTTLEEAPVAPAAVDAPVEAPVEAQIEAPIEAQIETPTETQVEEHLVALPPPDEDDDNLFGLPPPAPPPPPPPARPNPAAVDSLAPLLTRASAAGVDRLEPPSQGPSTVMPAGQAKSAKRNAAAAARKRVTETRAAETRAADTRAETQPVVAAAPPPDDEPEFVRSSRLREETGATRQRLMLAGAVVLALLLLAQGVWTFRNTMAARYPATRAVLGGACAVLGCKVELPAQIDALAVETGELQSLDATTFSFTTLLRNQGDLVQAWPHLELALTDTNDKTLVRRVFTPADYLPPGAAARGFAARSEQPIKLHFQLDQIKASGYHLAIFYP